MMASLRGNLWGATISVCLFVLVLGACSSGNSNPAQDAAMEASTSADRGGGADRGGDLFAADSVAPDQSADDLAAGEGGALDDCVIKRVTDKNECHPDCGGRALLPGGDTYCTQMCETTAECTPYGAELKCASDFGACVPPCTLDSECTALGFARCVLPEGVCDTI